jgi:4'-phosphopantetheinyl transferase
VTTPSVTHEKDAGAGRSGDADVGGGPRADPAGLQALRTGDVHVWYVDLALAGHTVRRLAACLSPDERARAAQFKFDRDARRFAVARSALRRLLSGYLGLTPDEVTFAYAAYGKPSLAGVHAALSFNLSHSGEVAVVAAGWDRAIGVDVEERRPLPDLAALAAQSFAPREQAMLAALPEGERVAAFFRCWTRKEAFIKATGQGLAQPLEAFVVSLGPAEPARLLDINGDPGALARWSLYDLQPPLGYPGALVVERGCRIVHEALWSVAEMGG